MKKIATILFLITQLNFQLFKRTRDPNEERFDKFIKKYGRKYNSLRERLYRYRIFLRNYLNIKEDANDDPRTNQSWLRKSFYKVRKYVRGKRTTIKRKWDKKINEFIDLTDEEFQDSYLLPEYTLYENIKIIRRKKKEKFRNAERSYQNNNYSNAAYNGNYQNNINDGNYQNNVNGGNYQNNVNGGNYQTNVNDENYQKNINPNENNNSSNYNSENFQNNQNGGEIKNPDNYPRSLNWLEKGKVSKVKHQSRCNSCYSFSTNAAIESYELIFFNNKINLSEQEVIDCDKTNYGCKGGQPALALQYIIDNGVSYYKNYPYKGKASSCKILKNEGRFLQEIDYNNYGNNSAISIDGFSNRTNFSNFNLLNENKNTVLDSNKNNFVDVSTNDFDKNNIVKPKNQEVFLNNPVISAPPKEKNILNNNFTTEYLNYNSGGKPLNDPFVYNERLKKTNTIQQIDPKINNIFIEKKNQTTDDYFYNTKIEDPFKEFNKTKGIYKDFQNTNNFLDQQNLNLEKKIDPFNIFDQINNLSSNTKTEKFNHNKNISPIKNYNKIPETKKNYSNSISNPTQNNVIPNTILNSNEQKNNKILSNNDKFVYNLNYDKELKTIPNYNINPKKTNQITNSKIQNMNENILKPNSNQKTINLNNNMIPNININVIPNVNPNGILNVNPNNNQIINQNINPYIDQTINQTINQNINPNINPINQNKNLSQISNQNFNQIPNQNNQNFNQIPNQNLTQIPNQNLTQIPKQNLTQIPNQNPTQIPNQNSSQIPNLQKPKTQHRSKNIPSSKYSNLKDFRILEKSTKAIILALQKGPVIVAHYVSSEFKFYGKGIYDGAGCEDVKTVNHSSLIVGYDLEAETPYFLVKNSWGRKWGDGGYYKFAIGEVGDKNKGICLIAGTDFNMVPVYD